MTIAHLVTICVIAAASTQCSSGYTSDPQAGGGTKTIWVTTPPCGRTYGRIGAPVRDGDYVTFPVYVCIPSHATKSGFIYILYLVDGTYRYKSDYVSGYGNAIVGVGHVRGKRVTLIMGYGASCLEGFHGKKDLPAMPKHCKTITARVAAP